MKRVFAVLLLLAVASVAGAANYIGQAELNQALVQKKNVIIIDIQPAKEFEQHYLTGSIETNAFPAKTAEEKQRLDKTLAIINASTEPVIVVCPRGGSGAKNSYEYLISKGVDENRLRILKDGIAGWTFKEQVKQGR